MTRRFLSLLVPVLILLALAPTSDAAPSAAAPARVAPLMFIENVGQFGTRARFQVRGANASLFIADDALWYTFTDTAASNARNSKRDLPNPRTTARASQPTVRRGVNLKVSFVAANPKPRIEPFNRLSTRLSYFMGKDKTKWRANVPVWGGVRYKDLYPGIDLEITSENGQLTQRLIAQPNARVNYVQMRVEGASQLALDNNRLRVSTALGDVRLPMVVATDPRADALHPLIVGDVVGFPFARGTTANARVNVRDASDLLFGSYLGGSEDDFGSAIAVDANGAIYVTGATASANFPTTTGAFQTQLAGGRDVFVAKMDPSAAQLIYATFIGGAEDDSGNALRIGANGAAFIAGATNSTDFPTTEGAYQKNAPGNGDAFAVQLGPDGAALAYSTYLGGAASDVANGIALDADGNAYLTGETESSDFPITGGAQKQGQSDAFVTKLNASGSTLVYSTRIAGENIEAGMAIALDASNAAYVTGVTTSGNFTTSLKALDRRFDSGKARYASDAPCGDAFVVKLVSTGDAFAYSTFLGGNGCDVGNGIAVDASGNTFIIGTTNSTDFLTTPDAFQKTLAGENDAFIVKLNGDASAAIYATLFGGANNDAGNGIVIDTNGNAIIAGSTLSANLPMTSNAFQSALRGDADAFIAKLNSTGSALMYATYLGGSGTDGGSAIALDANSRAFCTGITGSTDFPTSPTTYQGSPGGANDAFIVELVTPSAPPPTFSITGRVTDSASNPLTGVTLTIAPTGTATLDASGFFTVTNLITGTYTITPTKSGFTFTPTARTVSVPPNATAQNFVGAPTTYCISGRIADSAGNPIPGVIVNGSQTDTNGNYQICGLAAGTYIVTPAKTGYTFTPATRNVTVPPNATGVDFIGSVTTYTISGRITDSGGSPAAGIAISDGQGHTATTNGNGEYAFTNLGANTYTITPTKSGCTFAPASLSVTVPPDAPNKNFTINCPTLSTISGRVTDAAGNPIAGVSVRTTAGYSATTDAAGDYTITDLPPNTYNISASKTGCTFTPDVQPATVPPNATGKNFTGNCAPSTYSIAGRVSDNTGAPLANVTLSDGVGHTAISDASGTYILTNLIAGTYTITPAKSNYTFNPASSSVTVPPNASAINFVGTPSGNKPQPPATVTATDGTYATHILIVWSNVVGASKYKVYRNTINDPLTATLLATIDRLMRYEDRSAIPDTPYYYWVVANNGVDSDFSQPDTGWRASNWQVENVNWRVDYGASWIRIGRITKPGATNVRVHFSAIYLANGDQLKSDAGDIWTGSLTDITSKGTIDKNTLTLTLTSNGASAGYFIIDRIEYQGTSAGPATWRGDLIVSVGALNWSVR
jgi:protocatechuate 3,4-dioxygenase beta subunit